MVALCMLVAPTSALANVRIDTGGQVRMESHLSDQPCRSPLGALAAGKSQDIEINHI
jgi:hypothetical protein